MTNFLVFQYRQISFIWLCSLLYDLLTIYLLSHYNLLAVVSTMFFATFSIVVSEQYRLRSLVHHNPDVPSLILAYIFGMSLLLALVPGYYNAEGRLDMKSLFDMVLTVALVIVRRKVTALQKASIEHFKSSEIATQYTSKESVELVLYYNTAFLSLFVSLLLLLVFWETQSAVESFGRLSSYEMALVAGIYALRTGIKFTLPKDNKEEQKPRILQRYLLVLCTFVFSQLVELRFDFLKPQLIGLTFMLFPILEFERTTPQEPVENIDLTPNGSTRDLNSGPYPRISEMVLTLSK